mgnify:CR=1 FL=1
MKLLYIAFKDFSNLHFGANAKVLSQCRAFEEYGYDVELIGRKGADTVVITPDGKHETIFHGNTVAKNQKMQNLLSKRNQMTDLCIREKRRVRCLLYPL